MKKNKVTKWDVGEDFLIESAEKRIERGDYLGALTMLNKRGSEYPPSADAFALYADIYEALELWQAAADAWFRFLDTCNEADFGEGFEGLAVVFMNMGNELQSAYYFRCAYGDEDDMDDFGEPDPPEEERPNLRLVGDEEPEILREGLMLMRVGELDHAREKFLEVDDDSSDYPSAAALAAMCSLMAGDEEGAENECRELLKVHPDNIQALTTYCAVLGARENKEEARRVARHLFSIGVEETDDMYRAATALCETGLDEEAEALLSRLLERLPYDDTILFFHAVACYHIGKYDEAIASLERVTTLFPRKAVARYCLERMRRVRDGEEEPFPMSYFYRVPEDQYRTVADFLLTASNSDDRELAKLAALNDPDLCFRIAFDELEGRDEKLQTLAVRVALRMGADDFLREVLLDPEVGEIIKLSIMHGLVMRNEENSFGTVFLNLYKEFYTHRIEIGPKKADAFLKAFADVYSKYGLFGEDNEGKLCGAAEDLYRAIEEAEAWQYIEEREALAAAIYREARIKGGERSIEEICKMFDADRLSTQCILDFLM